MSQFTDPRDGLVYKTVEIGGFVWLAENLAFNHPKARIQNYNPSILSKYGRLYEWDIAMESVIPGWRLPMEEDWQLLIGYSGGFEEAGKHLKSKEGWFFDNGLDTYGFNGLAGGYYDLVHKEYNEIGVSGYWWSAREREDMPETAHGWKLRGSSEGIVRFVDSKKEPVSVRLVKEETD